MIPVANMKLGIEFKHLNMLKIQNVGKSSDTFAFILPQQRPVLVSAHAQNFLNWSWAKKMLQGNAIQLQMKDIYHIYNFVERLQWEF